ncbi:hypothetical protein ABLB84_01745 [Xenorhabdus szentirmaii]|uniref:hypothetical protein n=1 Tax=Xenorhabdus szentirmaii TaxID=290112 RepID=UPI0032B75D7D
MKLNAPKKQPEGLFKHTTPGSILSSLDNTQSAPKPEILDTVYSVYMGYKGIQNMNYVNINRSGWMVFESSPETTYDIISYEEKYYIIIANGPYKNYYLGYSIESYIGAYEPWNNASYWTSAPVDNFPYPGIYGFKGKITPYNLGDNNVYACVNGYNDGVSTLKPFDIY